MHSAEACCLQTVAQVARLACGHTDSNTNTEHAVHVTIMSAGVQQTVLIELLSTTGRARLQEQLRMLQGHHAGHCPGFIIGIEFCQLGNIQVAKATIKSQRHPKEL
jgi:hypothetical protein